MRILVLLLFVLSTTSAFAYSVNLEVGHFKYKEKYGLFKIKKKIKKKCERPFLNKDRIVFFDCPYVVLVGEELKVTGVPKKYDVNLILKFPKNEEEHFYGIGTQYTHFRLNGQKFEFLSQEQGNGRGIQPLGFFQALIKPGLGGNSTTTYASSPVVYSSKLYSLVFDTYAYGTADFTKKKTFELAFHTRKLKFKRNEKSSWKDLIEVTTSITGRMRELPEWIQDGAIIGLMGGKDSVEKRLDKLAKADVKMAGVWLQDWVGQRQTRIGPRLIWDWQRQNSTYRDLNFEVPTLGYFNPFLSPLPEGEERHSLFLEAKEKDYLVKLHGKPHGVDNGGFDGYLVDLFNGEARSWLKEIIKEKVIENNFIGWMADFAEAYPFDATTKENHHRYIEEWIKLNREVVDEVDPKNLTFFNRASYLRGPRYSTLNWLGDQTSSWDEKDGMHSSLIGLITGGLSGQSLNHSDIGGYVSFCMKPFVCIKRTEELLIRWMEMNAFGLVFRTHLGLKPSIAAQIDTSEKTIKAFAKWSKVFAELKEYKQPYIKEAANKGIPVVRPMFVEFPRDEKSYYLNDQYMLGNKLLVAPVLKPGVSKRKVYFPKGEWKHYFDGSVIKSDGEVKEVAAPLGKPPVFIFQ